MEDQGEAWDRVQRLLDEMVADMTPNGEGNGLAAFSPVRLNGGFGGKR